MPAAVTTVATKVTEGNVLGIQGELLMIDDSVQELIHSESGEQAIEKARGTTPSIRVMMAWVKLWKG